MENKFYPSIYGVEIRNYSAKKDSYEQMHVTGDVYLDGECIGYYDPIYQPESGKPYQVFLRLTDPEGIREKFAHYYSQFYYQNTTFEVDDVIVTPRGIEVLLQDLEYLVTIYERYKDAVNSEQNAALVCAITNGPSTKFFPFDKEPDVDISRDDDLIDFIEDKSHVLFDLDYPCLVFRKEEDFRIKKSVLEV